MLEIDKSFSSFFFFFKSQKKKPIILGPSILFFLLKLHGASPCDLLANFKRVWFGGQD
jgi:hypothetical protein